MTIEEAIGVLSLAQNHIGVEYINGVENPFMTTRLQCAIDIAISNLCAQQEVEKNEPLTIEELYACRKDCVPIWAVAPLDKGELSGWAFLESTGAVSRNFAFWYAAYGKDWVAYRRPPEKEA